MTEQTVRKSLAIAKARGDDNELKRIAKNYPHIFEENVNDGTQKKEKSNSKK